MLDGKAIVLTEDMNENSEDDNSNDTEEDFKCSSLTHEAFQFYVAQSDICPHVNRVSSLATHPYFEIQSPPPQQKL